MTLFTKSYKYTNIGAIYQIACLRHFLTVGSALHMEMKCLSGRKLTYLAVFTAVNRHTKMNLSHKGLFMSQSLTSDPIR